MRLRLEREIQKISGSMIVQRSATYLIGVGDKREGPEKSFG
jgi:hypothetical protein